MGVKGNLKKEDLLSDLGISPFKERLPWIGPDLQTLRDTFASDELPDAYSSEIRIKVPPLKTRKAGGGFLVAYLDKPSSVSSINGLVLLLHGLGGSTRRRGLTRMASALVQSNFAVLKLNLRGSDPCRDFVDGTYAAECNSDLIPVLRRAREISYQLTEDYQSSKNIPVFGAGISLGGTILLNACMCDESLLDGLVCISSPLDLNECSSSIERPRNFIYQKWLLNRLIRQTLEDPFGVEEREKNALLINRKDKERKINDIRSFDNFITAPRWGYKDVGEYYAKASPFFSLIENKKSLPKTLFIQSKDDPWVPFLAAEKLMEKMKFSNNQMANQFIFTEKGGHNGFHGVKGCWGDQVVSKWLLSLKTI
ncbi:alpha/beta fold hydrolase [Prochlorococcus marinus]|uniref:Alpha/beta hydrolase n=1 Tax=Prochlorococcus marinus XMU1408 TaxID=2213228 RepID=A0A318R2G3_PROMR|nr:alpha/beta fold hydrolase [Prochlorococcus marinus]MBW3042359.1 alpha/beta hydrolase [Prochlorococcus marinus str. XMU1408]PYE01100.1 alpha/beta hydrolase [Prochlorococcus marinus XMU1408]